MGPEGSDGVGTIVGIEVVLQPVSGRGDEVATPSEPGARDHFGLGAREEVHDALVLHARIPAALLEQRTLPNVKRGDVLRMERPRQGADGVLVGRQLLCVVPLLLEDRGLPRVDHEGDRRNPVPAAAPGPDPIESPLRLLEIAGDLLENPPQRSSNRSIRAATSVSLCIEAS
jgi:hypothetical protein